MTMPSSPADRDWLSFLGMARPKVDWSLVGRVICLDPGETTGWADFDRGKLIRCGQWSTPNPAEMAAELRAFFGEDFVWPDGLTSGGLTPRIVYETYRIRGNKAKEHVGSEVVTIQNIGAIKVVADELWIEPVGQSAGMAKGFATDTKLRRWGLYQSNQRHAMDAVRHGCYWHLFVAGRR